MGKLVRFKRKSILPLLVVAITLISNIAAVQTRLICELGELGVVGSQRETFQTHSHAHQKPDSKKVAGHHDHSHNESTPGHQHDNSKESCCDESGLGAFFAPDSVQLAHPNFDIKFLYSFFEISFDYNSISKNRLIISSAVDRPPPLIIQIKKTILLI